MNIEQLEAEEHDLKLVALADLFARAAIKATPAEDYDADQAIKRGLEILASNMLEELTRRITTRPPTVKA